MLHNFMRQSSYADVFAGCGVAVGGAAGVQAADGPSLGKLPPLCYLRNDHSTPFSGTIIVSLVALSNGITTKLAEISAEVGGGGGASALFCPTGGRLLGTTANHTAVCGSYASVLAAAGCKPTTCYLDIATTSGEHAGETHGYHEESTGVLYAHNEQLLPVRLHSAKTDSRSPRSAAHLSGHMSTKCPGILQYLQPRWLRCSEGSWRCAG